MRRSTAPTLKDIAAEAGVSSMVASVVLNGARSSTRVSPTTRARIVEVAARLDYRPNALARSLSRKLVETLGVVSVVDVGAEVNLYFLAVLDGILEAATELRHNVTVFSIGSWRDGSRIASLFDGRVDGMILLGPRDAGQSLKTRLPRHTPCVAIHSSADLPDVWNVDVDSERGAYDMVRYLYARGHRRVAHFRGDANVLGSQQRLTGYKRALRELGLPYDQALIFEGEFNVSSGRRAAAEMLARFPRQLLPTAVFCASDAIACGCLEVLSASGIRVPDDVSVAGFDDTIAALTVRPTLTTVRQPYRLIGRRAVERLLPQIRSDIGHGDSAAGADDPARAEVLPVELVVRDSVAPPRPTRDA